MAGDTRVPAIFAFIWTFFNGFGVQREPAAAPSWCPLEPVALRTGEDSADRELAEALPAPVRPPGPEALSDHRPTALVHLLQGLWIRGLRIQNLPSLEPGWPRYTAAA
jgi:hypothetical protein